MLVINYGQRHIRRRMSYGNAISYMLHYLGGEENLWGM